MRSQSEIKPCKYKILLLMSITRTLENEAKLLDWLEFLSTNIKFDLISNHNSKSTEWKNIFS